MSDAILNLITWVDDTSLAICDYFGISAGSVVAVAFIAGLLIWLTE